MFGAKRLLLLKREGFRASDVVDVPEAEAAALIWLYENTNGPGWTDNTNWLQTPTVANWFGVTVSGGHVYQLALQSNNLVGSVAGFPIDALQSMILLSLYTNAGVTGDISGWAIPDAMRYYRLDNTGVSGDVALMTIPPACVRWYFSYTSISGSMNGLVIPATMDDFRLNNSQVSGGVPDYSNAVVLSDVRIYGLGLSQADVDANLLGFYNRRMSFTYATPVLYIHTTNSAPSGIYQAACPPTTGKEYQFELSNDSCGDGFNLWTITATV